MRSGSSAAMASRFGSGTVPTTSIACASSTRYAGTPASTLSTAAPTGTTPSATAVSVSTGSSVTTRCGAASSSTVPRACSTAYPAAVSAGAGAPVAAGSGSDEHAVRRVAASTRAVVVTSRRTRGLDVIREIGTGGSFVVG
ncbi:hypothetical protein OY671_000822 [Metschnikowia pulcherrima]|nr:hypothetical protein OY671_000822 [Metschnikowia pulcherrima]